MDLSSGNGFVICLYFVVEFRIKEGFIEVIFFRLIEFFISKVDNGLIFKCGIGY